MPGIPLISRAFALGASLAAFPLLLGAADRFPANETPGTFMPGGRRFDYVERDVMIPMRDGVKLHTVILVPKGAKRAPILLTRTPYDADAIDRARARARTSAASLDGYDNAADVIVEGGYIRVVQDMRGKYGSEGDYVMNRPLRRPAEPHAGRRLHRHLRHHRLAGEERARDRTARSASSASPTTASPPLMALVNPHPALKVVGADEPDGRRLDGRRLVPQRRVPPAEHAPTSTSRKPRAATAAKWWTEHYDDYDTVPAGRLGRRARRRRTGWNRSASGSKMIEHPAYDAFWQRPGDGQDARRAAAEGADDAGAQPVGPGGHLRRHRRLQGARAARTRTTTRSFWSIGPVAPRPGDRRTAARSARCASAATRRASSAAQHPAPVPRRIT